MTSRECGDEVRELYTCRICAGDGLCAECALLCEDDLPFTKIAPEQKWPEEPGDERCASLIERAEHALLVKPQGHCVRVPHPDGSVWDV